VEENIIICTGINLKFYFNYMTDRLSDLTFKYLQRWLEEIVVKTWWKIDSRESRILSQKWRSISSTPSQK
jgi:hypothetical protein